VLLLLFLLLLVLHLPLCKLQLAERQRVPAPATVCVKSCVSCGVLLFSTTGMATTTRVAAPAASGIYVCGVFAPAIILLLDLNDLDPINPLHYVLYLSPFLLLFHTL
jgi:hypothetical protein